MHAQRRRPYLHWRAALAGALLALIAGCHGGDASGAKVLRYPIQVEPSTLDPAKLTDIYTNELLENIYDGLVMFDQNSRVVPDLAERWEASADGNTYTFHLRTNARFHNGRPVTADDVKYSIERSLWKETTSPTAANYLAPIVGAAAVAAGKRRDLVGVRVVDAHTLEIRIDRPRGYFLGMLAYPTAWVVCREAVEKAGRTAAGGAAFDEAAAVGTGPYKLAEYRHGAKVTLEANAEYFLGRPKLDRVERPIVLDFPTAHIQFESGQADFIATAPSDIAADRNNPALRDQTMVLPYADVQYMVMHPGLQSVFRKPLVRQAIAQAIDRDDIIARATHGVYQRAEGFVPPGVPGYGPHVRAHSYEPAAAQRLLAQAGYPDGRGFPRLTLVFIEHQPDTEASAQIIRDDLKRVLNIDVDLQARESATFIADTNQQKVPFYVIAWIADYPDAQDFLSTLLRSHAPLNRVGYSNPRFDTLCDKADALSGMDERVPLYQQADQIAMDDVALVPLWYQKLLYLKKPYVRDLAVNVMQPLPLLGVHLAR